MDPLSAITTAIIAGATAAASETASKTVKDAYEGLKRVLVDGYKFVSANLIDKKPSNKAYQEAVQAEVEENFKMLDDPTLLAMLKKLQDALRAESPTKLSMLGIDINHLEAGGNLIAEHIGGGIRGDSWSAKGDVKFSDVAPSSGKF